MPLKCAASCDRVALLDGGGKAHRSVATQPIQITRQVRVSRGQVEQLVIKILMK